mgnify:CR=1 FL=1
MLLQRILRLVIHFHFSLTLLCTVSIKHCFQVVLQNTESKQVMMASTKGFLLAMRKFLLHNLTFSEQTFSKLMMTTERPSPFWKAYKIALNVYSLSFTLRLPFISFIYRFGSSSNEGKSHKLAYFGVDPLAEFASAVLHLDDPNMVLVLGTMPIFTVYIDYQLTFGREKGATTWRLLNDLVVVNRRQLASRFKDSAVESGVENGVAQKQQQKQQWWYKRWHQKVRSLWSAEEETATASKVETAFTTKLAAMFSSQTRSRLLVVSTVTGLLFSSFFIFWR